MAELISGRFAGPKTDLVLPSDLASGTLVQFVRRQGWKSAAGLLVLGRRRCAASVALAARAAPPCPGAPPRQGTWAHELARPRVGACWRPRGCERSALCLSAVAGAAARAQGHLPGAAQLGRQGALPHRAQPLPERGRGARRPLLRRALPAVPHATTAPAPPRPRAPRPATHARSDGPACVAQCARARRGGAGRAAGRRGAGALLSLERARE
jgi:hypothetical protein